MPEVFLLDKLSHYKIILASKSPRRSELMQQMGLRYEQAQIEVEENFPGHLKGPDITDFLARLKADAYPHTLKEHEILITADTIVWYEGRLLGKPKDLTDAKTMLQELSDDWHEVISSVCCTSKERQMIRHETTLVRFHRLREPEIDYYLEKFNPLDKAGAYGIQEWIGHMGISEISGSYNNVVGLPTASLYQLLRAMVS